MSGDNFGGDDHLAEVGASLRHHVGVGCLVGVAGRRPERTLPWDTKWIPEGRQYVAEVGPAHLADLILPVE